MIDLTELEAKEILTCISMTIAEYGEFETHKSILNKILSAFPGNEEIQEKATDLLKWIGDDEE